MRYVDIDGNEIDPSTVDESLGHWVVEQVPNPDVQDVVEDDFYDKVSISFKSGFYCQFRADMEPLLVKTEDGYEWDTENDPQGREVERMEVERANSLGSMNIDTETPRVIEQSKWVLYTAEELAERQAQESSAARTRLMMETLRTERNTVVYGELLGKMLDSVGIPEPPAKKLGFLTVWTYDPESNRVVWTFEPDPEYVPTNDGTDYTRPITFVAGMDVTEGLWYTDGEDIWECVQAGIAESFTAPWFEVIS